MTREQLLSELKAIYKDIVGDKHQQHQITEKTDLVHDLGMMSISFVYMSFVIEKRFNINMENVSFSSFKTVGDVIDYIINNNDITK